MISQKSYPLSVFKNLDNIKILGFLAIITWIAHFWHFASFGLYEDDLWRFSNVMEKNWLEILGLLLDQGRLLHDGLIYFFFFLGLKLKLGGLHVLYLIGYTIVTINSFLFYLLLKRMFAKQGFAIIGALAFCLFPADTTQPFLTHSLGVQPSLTFLLIALHFYLSERKKLSYLVILGSLFCYEPIFPVFLTAPLLKKRWDSRLIRELLSHAVVLGVMIVSVVILRKVMGEGRVSSFGVFEAMLLVGNPIVGPITSMSMFVYRPIETLLKLNGELLMLLPLCFAGFTWVLSRLKLARMNDAFRLTTRFESRVFRTINLPESFNNFAKPVALGLIMLVLAYPLTLTTFGYSISGRGTRVHTAAVVGASILCACVCVVILHIAAAHSKKRLATLGLVGFFTLLVGFGLIVQRDYKLSWQYQRAFWSDVVRLCPDVTDGTVIVVEPVGLRNPRQIMAHSWALPLVLGQIYQFPDDWKIPPRLYKLIPDWQNYIGSDENLLHLKRTTWNYFPFIRPQHKDLIVESSNVILLDTNNGRMTRRTEPLSIGNQDFILKEISASEPSLFEKGPLYDYLISAPDSAPISYLK